ncbi:MAG: hypothetical protein Q9186_005615 [Xanthomendoza sp. 1 TL-2023]
MKLYGFGSNGSGQLGIAHTNDTSLPQLCHLADDQNWPSPIRTIKSGGNHTLVLLESGHLYVSGSTKDGRTGLNLKTDLISQFTEVSNSTFGGSKVKLCSALWEASVIVTEDDEVFTLGVGLKGELGIGTGGDDSPHRLERFWPSEEQIVDLSSGITHTVIILSNGEVYGWGNGRKGQLGQPAMIVWEPRKIQSLSLKAVRAVCGTDFSYLVGDPEHGHHVVLGSDKWNVKSHAPALIPGWKDVAASWGSVFMLSKTGGFQSWGRNDHGQLGPEKHPAGFARISAGSEHALALTDNGTDHGNVAAWGWGEHGNCGPGPDPQGDVQGWWNEIPASRFGRGCRIVGTAAGCATSFVWTEEVSHQPIEGFEQAKPGSSP